MFKGTSEAPGGTFSRLVARHGGRENAFTTHDATAYHQTVARDQLELMMRLEADRMRNLVLTDEAVETEREVILEERRQRIGNEPGALLGEHMAAVLYLAHPYGNPVIGWEHEIRALTPDDIRSFYDQHYRPNNAILVVAGDATAAQVRPLAEKYYGALAARTAAPRFRVTEPEPMPRAASNIATDACASRAGGVATSLRASTPAPPSTSLRWWYWPKSSAADRRAGSTRRSSWSARLRPMRAASIRRTGSISRA